MVLDGDNTLGIEEKKNLPEDDQMMKKNVEESLPKIEIVQRANVGRN